MNTALFQLLETIRDTVFNAGERVRPEAVVRRCWKVLGVGRNEVKNGIRALVDAGELEYSLEFGSSFLRPSFNRPVRIGRRVVVRPPDMRWPERAGDAVIVIARGAAFGSGVHPTTRLAVLGIEWVVEQAAGTAIQRVLDVGTGSGVLVLSALRLGAGSGIGIDIDPCAIAEAGTNCRLNGLERRVMITDQSLDALNDSFDLVLANLRLPTLTRMAERLTALSTRPGALVCSGFRPEESGVAEAAHAILGWVLAARFEANGWAGLVLRR